MRDWEMEGKGGKQEIEKEQNESMMELRIWYGCHSGKAVGLA